MFQANDWLPKSVLTLRQYDKQQLIGDVIAGITVGFVAVPLAGRVPERRSRGWCML